MWAWDEVQWHAIGGSFAKRGGLSAAGATQGDPGVIDAAAVLDGVTLAFSCRSGQLFVGLVGWISPDYWCGGEAAR